MIGIIYYTAGSKIKIWSTWNINYIKHWHIEEMYVCFFWKMSVLVYSTVEQLKLEIMMYFSVQYFSTEQLQFIIIFLIDRASIYIL